MVTSNGSASIRSSNGGSDFLSGVLWRNRIGVIKGCILFLFVMNMFYFGARYVELTSTVRRLEAEKAIGCSRITANEDASNAKQEKTKDEKSDGSDKDAPLLNYSQVCTIY